jgi:tetratricopeptide (TPR) repeat protein
MRISPALAPALLLIFALTGCAANPEMLVTRCDEAGSPERGVRICSDAIKAENLSPHQQAKILSDRGYYLVGLGRYDEAIVDYNRSIELNPDMGGTYNRRGYAYRGKRDWEAALKDLDRAVEMLPDFAEARYSRGRVHFELGHIDAAMADYDKAIELDPKDVKAYNSRGHTYYTLKQWDLAVPEYKRAIEIDPKFSGGHQNLGTTYVELKEYQLALEEYDRALELDPENSFIYAQRATARAWIGDIDGATEDAKMFLGHMDGLQRYDLDPAVFKTYSLALLGMIQIRQADYATAVSTFDQLIKDNPKSAEAYYLRSAAHRLAGDDAKADADCRTALELDPEINDRMNAWLQS